jgi:hypothetical protein
MVDELKDSNIKIHILNCGRCNTQLRKLLVVHEDETKIMQSSDVAKFIKFLVTEDNVLDGNIITVRKQI